MMSHRLSPSNASGLIGLTIAATLMASAPIGAAFAAGAGAGPGVGAAAASAGQASNGSGYEPSETDCVTIAQQPGRYAPDDLAACGVAGPAWGYGYGYDYGNGRG